MTDRATARLRALLARPGCVVAPGVADALAARLVALEGFDAVYMTGFGTSLTRLGMPDVGLLTASEMIDNAGRIVDASGLPVSDATFLDEMNLHWFSSVDESLWDADGNGIKPDGTQQ